MTDPKAQVLVKRARNLFAYLGKKYSISPQHLAEADDWIERLEDFLGDAELRKS
jgi:hypothetical protein